MGDSWQDHRIIADTHVLAAAQHVGNDTPFSFLAWLLGHLALIDPAGAYVGLALFDRLPPSDVNVVATSVLIVEEFARVLGL